jgi:hypothetical protein
MVRESDIMDRMLTTDSYVNSLITIRTILGRLYTFLPREVLQKCITIGNKMGLIKYFLGLKCTGPAIIEWLVDTLSALPTDEHNFKECNELLKHLESQLKGKAGEEIDRQR